VHPNRNLLSELRCEPDCHEIFEDLRTTCPVAHGAEFGGYWLLTKYDDLRAVFADTQRFRTAP
jgi:cytochrome P450